MPYHLAIDPSHVFRLYQIIKRFTIYFIRFSEKSDSYHKRLKYVKYRIIVQTD